MFVKTSVSASEQTCVSPSQLPAFTGCTIANRRNVVWWFVAGMRAKVASGNKALDGEHLVDQLAKWQIDEFLWDTKDLLDMSNPDVALKCFSCLKACRATLVSPASTRQPLHLEGLKTRATNFKRGTAPGRLILLSMLWVLSLFTTWAVLSKVVSKQHSGMLRHETLWKAPPGFFSAINRHRQCRKNPPGKAQRVRKPKD